VADGDYERGRGREIAGYAAMLKRLAATRAAGRTRVIVFNGWSASPAAWDLCRFPRERIFSYLDQLDGAPERLLETAPAADRFVLVGWSMGGSSALRLAARHPDRVRGLVLVAATPRMMEEPATGWRGMSQRRLDALFYGAKVTHGAGLFGMPEGVPNPYQADCEENLARGITYLLETDIRSEVRRLAAVRPELPVALFQSERDGIVRPENADWLAGVFPRATLHRVAGTEHALSVRIPAEIDAAVTAFLG